MAKEKQENNFQNQNSEDFIKDNIKYIKVIESFTESRKEDILYITEKAYKLNMYLANVKIMIITANEVERETLFNFFAPNTKYCIIRIGKGNLIYSFFKIGHNNVVHVEPTSTGSYTKGGTGKIIEEALKIVKPNIVLSVGVAFGLRPDKNQLGDVLIGRQHFSYDKGTKMSEGKIDIKRLHIEEPDEYMLCRVQAMIPTESPMFGYWGNKFNVTLGNMLTGEFVIDYEEFKKMVFSPFEPFGVVGGEMEAYGLYEEVNQNQDVHCLLIKGICDWGSNKNDLKDVEGLHNNPKNNLQILAMFNTCEVCQRFLKDDKIFSDERIRGCKKRFWRIGIGLLIRKRQVNPYY
ncbi:MAG: hypothetical protein NC121_17615 [Blautia sp.]|nr:hypothetical protein [Blautia sp.]